MPLLELRNLRWFEVGCSSRSCQAIPDALSDSIPLLGAAGQDHAVAQLAKHVFESVTDTGHWLLDVVGPDEDDPASTPSPIRMRYNGLIAGSGDGREVHLETWSYCRFLKYGGDLINDLARDQATRVLFVSQQPGGRNLDRLAAPCRPVQRSR